MHRIDQLLSPLDLSEIELDFELGKNLSTRGIHHACDDKEYDDGDNRGEDVGGIHTGEEQANFEDCLNSNSNSTCAESPSNCPDSSAASTNSDTLARAWEPSAAGQEGQSLGPRERRMRRTFLSLTGSAITGIVWGCVGLLLTLSLLCLWRMVRWEQNMRDMHAQVREQAATPSAGAGSAVEASDAGIAAMASTARAHAANLELVARTVPQVSFYS